MDNLPPNPSASTLPSPKNRSWIIIVVIVAVLICAGAVYYFFFYDQEESNENVINNANQVSVNSTQDNSNIESTNTNSTSSAKKNINDIDLSKVNLNKLALTNMNNTNVKVLEVSYQGDTRYAPHNRGGVAINEQDGLCTAWPPHDSEIMPYESRSLPESWALYSSYGLRGHCSQNQTACESSYQMVYEGLGAISDECYEESLDCIKSNISGFNYIEKEDGKKCIYNYRSEEFCCQQLGYKYLDRDIGVIAVDEEEKKEYEEQQLEHDADLDEVNDAVEKWFGMSNQTNDSDGDGYNDFVEVEGCFNPVGSGRMDENNYLTYCQNAIMASKEYIIAEEASGSINLNEQTISEVCEEWKWIAQEYFNAKLASDNELPALPTTEEIEKLVETCNNTADIVNDTSEEKYFCHAMQFIPMYMCGEQRSQPLFYAILGEIYYYKAIPGFDEIYEQTE